MKQKLFIILIFLIFTQISCDNDLFHDGYRNNEDYIENSSKLENLKLQSKTVTSKSDLQILTDISQSFDCDQTDYSINVENRVTTITPVENFSNIITITPTALNDKAEIYINNKIVNSNEESEQISILPGENEINIVVTGLEDRTSTYKLQINRKLVFDGDYSITDSASYKSLAGYTVITGSLNITGNFTVDGNPLVDLQDLSSLTSIKNIFISDTNSLTNLSGLDNLTELSNTDSGFGFSIKLYRNSSLSDLSVFSKFSDITGTIDLDDNQSLTSFSGFHNIKKVNGSVLVLNNPVLSGNGFDALEEITASLNISSNTSWTSIEGFDKLKKVGLSVFIQFNTSLLNTDAQLFVDTLDSYGDSEVSFNKP